MKCLTSAREALEIYHLSKEGAQMDGDESGCLVLQFLMERSVEVLRITGILCF